MSSSLDLPKQGNSQLFNLLLDLEASCIYQVWAGDHIGILGIVWVRERKSSMPLRTNFLFWLTFKWIFTVTVALPNEMYFIF
jgi:hypothetical protein